ncbi:MAG: M48 family metalloprotease [Gemmatimonadota bacterium]
MDFFEAQSNALRLSRRLIVLFALAVAAMIAVVYLVALITFNFSGVGIAGGGTAAWLQPELLGGVALGMGAIIGAGSVFRTAQLRKGGTAVAELLGGREVPAGTGDPLERRLRNVVEEMSIASGIPVPAVYVLERESGINAFAAGNSIHDAAVAVTRGSLEALSRDELQGVIAHEFSHILNGDMRLNLRLIGLLFGILLLTVVGRGILRGSGGRRGGKGGGQVALVGLVLVLLGYLGVLFGRMIQAAVSRQREFLADASAVQFTRNPDGIAGALRKIGAGQGSRVQNHHADEVGHLFFANGLRGALSQVMSTHPPLEERIRRLDPRWDGRLDVGKEKEPTGAPTRKGKVAVGPGSGRGAGSSQLPLPLPFPIPGLPGSGGSGIGVQASGLVGSVGTLAPRHLAYAQEFLSRIPTEVREVAHEPEGAVALVVALLLSSSGEVHGRQLDLVRAALGEKVERTAVGLAPLVERVGPAGRLPLLDLALPALRALSPERGAEFESTVSALIRADGRVHPFEFALFHVVRRNLEGPRGDRGRPPKRRLAPISRLRVEAETVLSALARSGARDEEEIQHAFAAGATLLFPDTIGVGEAQPAGAVQLDRVDEALGRLADLRPSDLRRLLDAAVATIHADRHFAVPELEMLRAVAEALDAPMPPIVAVATA